jgi:hypothetical protein
MALNWIGVGSVNPMALTPSIIAGDNPKLVNDIRHNIGLAGLCKLGFDLPDDWGVIKNG